MPLMLISLFGKAKLYAIFVVGVIAVVGMALLKARHAGAAAERRKGVDRLVKDLKISKEEIDASRARSDEEIRQRLKDRQK